MQYRLSKFIRVRVAVFDTEHGSTGNGHSHGLMNSIGLLIVSALTQERTTYGK